MKQDYVFNKNLKAITKHKPQLLPHIKKPTEFTKLTPLFKADMASEILKVEYIRSEVNKIINGQKADSPHASAYLSCKICEYDRPRG